MKDRTQCPMRIQFCLVATLLLTVRAFQQNSLIWTSKHRDVSRTSSFSFARPKGPMKRPTSKRLPYLSALTEEEQQLNTKSDKVDLDKVANLRAEAQRIRLEAEALDASLTLEKIQAIEAKLNNKVWLKNHPDQKEELQKRLDLLSQKVLGNSAKPSTLESTTTAATAATTTTETSNAKDDEIKSEVESSAPLTPQPSTPKKKKSRVEIIENEELPLNGYDKEDLEVYSPVVEEIDRRLANSTMVEKVEAFRTSPELQDYFNQKIQKLLVQPMEDMQNLEQLKKSYLESSSSVEKDQIKREIDKLQVRMQVYSPFEYSDSIYRNIDPMSEEELEARVDAVSKLSPILQALYKERNGVDFEGDLVLAILLDYHEKQMQLLDQVRFLDEVDDDMRHQVRLGVLSLPDVVRARLANGLGLEDDTTDVSTIVEALCSGINGSNAPPWIQLSQVIEGGSSGGSSSSADPPDYDDIEFVDRSRYVDIFLPAISAMESELPSMEQMEELVNHVLDRKAFMVTSKPERVVGGYYLNGNNLLQDDDGMPRNDEMVKRIQQRLAASSLKDELDIFWIQEPRPPTDEELELGETDRPLFVVVSKNRNRLYALSTPIVKGAVSALGLLGVISFSLGVSLLQPGLQSQLAISDANLDVPALFEPAVQVAGALMAIQLMHELGHRIVAWKDKFDVALPTLIPSIELGLQGALTAFKSPPPNSKSLFDFSFAGPFLGMTASFLFLIIGLDATASMTMEEALHQPALTVTLLKSSALGGSLIEFFLGKGSLMANVMAESVLPLHPFAVAGFVGMISNALSLLPVGLTDGGRIALAMFGRRGTYLVKNFTTIVLVVAGLFGADDTNVLLTYVLFTMIWQRELEAPSYNEADELDFPRGLLGISTAIIVFLVLLPMS